MIVSWGENATTLGEWKALFIFRKGDTPAADEILIYSPRTSVILGGTKTLDLWHQHRQPVGWGSLRGR